MDISAFRDRPTGGAMTVSELNNFIKHIFDSNRTLSAITVKGEISNFKRHSSGHIYFSLKDNDGQIRAVMFKSYTFSMKFNPDNGMKVIVHGSVSVYPRDGSYQLYATSMQPDGIGALYMAYEQLKTKLEAEGLFSPEHKKPIPEYPASIGVITSPTGAAVRDIINVLGRRFPQATVYLYPALVQGDGAEPSLVRAVEYFDNSGLVDVVIIGRGGGSIEDLWAFNGEGLARRIFDADVPIISAVGHETDFTICDFVADLRAPTPSAAAELAVPDYRDVISRLASIADRCDASLLRMCERGRERLFRIIDNPLIKRPMAVVEDKREYMADIVGALTSAYKSIVTAAGYNLSTIAGKLGALNPLNTLSRGYSVVTKGDAVVSVDKLSVGDTVSVRVSDGEFLAMVTEITKSKMESL